MTLIDIDWQWVHYSKLTVEQLYSVMVLRQEVFVVEQDCPYLDADNLDQQSWHLLAWMPASLESKSPKLLAYARVVEAGAKFPEVSIGRVVTHSSVRRSGIGQQLMNTVIQRIDEHLGSQAIRISAQEYLQGFYQSFGFNCVSGIYMEDNIPHIEMLKDSK